MWQSGGRGGEWRRHPPPLPLLAKMPRATVAQVRQRQEAGGWREGRPLSSDYTPAHSLVKSRPTPNYSIAKSGNPSRARPQSLTRICVGVNQAGR